MVETLLKGVGTHVVQRLRGSRHREGPPASWDGRHLQRKVHGWSLTDGGREHKSGSGSALGSGF
jgi:hypothetical protein